ncbi:hypothetical protein [Neobacillus niacini]|uniref:hypothetical protein n=1 Tax=Neobacillus niacini TaxID=86668 RepID=UPI00203F3BBB|nr:hypothetical protein [Neobacillus niacini]MCM3694296.1 hypothetical protein [Neobacillus niacini]
MDASTWNLISIVGYSLSGILLIVVVFMFFKMNIPAIIGDLNGKTAARQIQEIREKNKLTGNKQHRPSTFNVERGTLTAPVSTRFGRTGRTGRTPSALSEGLENKGITAQTSRPTVLESLPTEVKQGSLAMMNEATTVLIQDSQMLQVEEMYGDGTEVLLMNETEVLEQGTEILMNETEVLYEGTVVLAEDSGTTVLNATGEVDYENVTVPLAVEFKIVKDIKITHSNEVI